MPKPTVRITHPDLAGSPGVEVSESAAKSWERRGWTKTKKRASTKESS